MSGVSDALEAFQNHSNASIEDTIAALEQLTVSGPAPSSSQRKRVTKDAVSVARTCLKTAHSRLKQFDSGDANANSKNFVADLVKVCCSCVDLLARNKEASTKNEQDAVRIFETATYTTLRLFITAAKAFNDAIKMAMLLQSHFDEAYSLCHGDTKRAEGRRTKSRSPTSVCTPDVVNMAIGTTVALVLCWAEGAAAFKDSNQVRSTLQAVQALIPQWLSQLSSSPDQVAKHQQTLFKSLYRGALRLIENKQLDVLGETCNVMVNMFRQAQTYLACNGNAMLLTAAYKLSSHIVEVEQRLALLGSIVLDGCVLQEITTDALSTILSAANSLRKLVALHIDSSPEDVLWFGGTDEELAIRTATALEVASTMVATRLQNQNQSEEENVVDVTTLLQSHINMAVVGLGYAARLRKMVSEKRAQQGRSRGRRRRRSVDAEYDLCGKVATLLGWPVETIDIKKYINQTTTTQIVRLECICSDDQLSWLSSYLHDVLTTYSSTTPVDEISSSLALASFMLALERWARKYKAQGSFGLEEVMKRMNSLFSALFQKPYIYSQALQLVLWRFCGTNDVPKAIQINGEQLVMVLASLMRVAMQANHDILVSAVSQCVIESSKHESTLGVGPLLVWAYLTVVKDHSKGVTAILCGELVASLDTAELKLIHALYDKTVLNTEVAAMVNNQVLVRTPSRSLELHAELRAAQEALALGLMATSLDPPAIDADLSLQAAGAIQKVLSHHSKPKSSNSSAPLTWTLDLLRCVATQVAVMCGVRGMVREEETILRTMGLPTDWCIDNTFLQCVFPRGAPQHPPDEFSPPRITSESLLSAALQHAEGNPPNMVEALHLAMQAYKESQVSTIPRHATSLGTLGDVGGAWQRITTRCRIVMTLGRLYEDTGMVEEAVSAFKEGRRLAGSINATLLEAVFVSELAAVQSKCCPGLVEKTVCSALSLLPSNFPKTDPSLAVVHWYINAQCSLARARIYKRPQATKVTRFTGHLPHAARPYVKAVEEAALALRLSCSDEKRDEINAAKDVKLRRTFPRSASAELQLELSILLSLSAAEHSLSSSDTTPQATVVYSPICDPSTAGTVEQWVALDACAATPHLYGRAALELVLPCARAGYGYIAAALLHLSMAPTLQFQHRLVLRTREKKEEGGKEEGSDGEVSCCCMWSSLLAWNEIVSEIVDEPEKKRAMLDRLEALARRMVHGWMSTASGRSACHSPSPSSSGTSQSSFVAAAVCPDGSGLLLCRSTWSTWSTCHTPNTSATPLLLHLPFGKFTVNDALDELDALMEESTYSMKSMPTSTRHEQREWWKCRLRLDDGMERLMARVQRRWFGPWYALLTLENEGLTSNAEFYTHDFVLDLVHVILGKREISSWQADQVISTISSSIKDLLGCLCTVARWLIKEKEGTNSKERKRQADAHLRQVALTTVDFVIRSFSKPTVVYESASSESMIDKVISEAFLRFASKASGASDGVEVIVSAEGSSWPVVLIPDSRLQRLPLELMPGLQGQSMYRIPSLPCVSEAKGTRSQKRVGMEVGTEMGLGRESENDPWPSVTSAYYALNPSGDLVETQQAFEEWFRQLPGWQGKSGIAPSAEELAQALRREDLFVYCGHGGGEQYLAPSKLRSLPRCAASLLMGCSSGRLRTSPFTPLTAGQEEGRVVPSPRVTKATDKVAATQSPCSPHRSYYEPTGTVLSYLLAGCPVAVATLWDVTDKDIDRFAERLLKGWLTEGGGGDVGLAVALARSACKLAHFIGGSIVCYGLPTQINGYVT